MSRSSVGIGQIPKAGVDEASKCVPVDDLFMKLQKRLYRVILVNTTGSRGSRSRTRVREPAAAAWGLEGLLWDESGGFR